MKTLIAIGTLALAALAGSVNASVVDTFDNPLTLSSTQASGAWYTDRYAPAGFVGGVSFGGRFVLEQSINAADSEANRPSGFNSSFYNTQGRKFDLPTATTGLSIELYVPASFGTSGQRNAGFWGTAFDNTNTLSFFPIIEFTNTTDGSGVARFRAWNGAGFVDMGLPTGFAYDTWQTLDISLVGANVVYTVGDLTLSVASGGSASIGNTILQGHNIGNGSTYDIHWDNLSAVPSPAAAALLGFGGLMAARRRRAVAV